jgi:putative membrane protein
MTEFLKSIYLYLLSIHLICAFAWMAGMLYLPRLYVYHAEAGPGTPQSETFKIMERRLLRGIVNPAMIGTWIFGALMAFGAHGVNFATDGWFHVKLTLVIILSTLHGLLARWRKDFEADRNRHSPRFYRIVNEVPALLLIGIVFMVVLKPF